MERIVIPQHATYSPVALTDVIVSAPFASRILLGATVPGQIIAAGALGAYLGSAAKDWYARRGIRPVDFKEAFGADVDQLTPMPDEVRREEMVGLAERLTENHCALQLDRTSLAKHVNRLLTQYIGQITGQEIITSTEIRDQTLTRYVFPFALGSCDAVSGDVAIYQDAGILEPHVITHEFAHRKGYLKELHAQVLSFLALRTSGHPLFVQAARTERLHRHLAVLADSDGEVFQREVDALPLNDGLRQFLLGFAPSATRSRASRAMRALYDQRMRLSGQNGLSDYDRGFTDFLYTFQQSSSASQPRHHADL